MWTVRNTDGKPGQPYFVDNNSDLHTFKLYEGNISIQGRSKEHGIKLS